FRVGQCTFRNSARASRRNVPKRATAPAPRAPALLPTAMAVTSLPANRPRYNPAPGANALSSGQRSSARLPMQGVAATTRAELLQLNALRIGAPILGRPMVSLFALRAFRCDPATHP